MSLIREMGEGLWKYSRVVPRKIPNSFKHSRHPSVCKTFHLHDGCGKTAIHLLGWQVVAVAYNELVTRNTCIVPVPVRNIGIFSLMTSREKGDVCIFKVIPVAIFAKTNGYIRKIWYQITHESFLLRARYFAMSKLLPGRARFDGRNHMRIFRLVGKGILDPELIWIVLVSVGSGQSLRWRSGRRRQRFYCRCCCYCCRAWRRSGRRHRPFSRRGWRRLVLSCLLDRGRTGGIDSASPEHIANSVRSAIGGGDSDRFSGVQDRTLVLRKGHRQMLIGFDQGQQRILIRGRILDGHIGLNGSSGGAAALRKLAHQFVRRNLCAGRGLRQLNQQVP